LRSQASFAELFFTMILAYVVLTVATKEVPAEWKTKQRLGRHGARLGYPPQFCNTGNMVKCH